MRTTVLAILALAAAAQLHAQSGDPSAGPIDRVFDQYRGTEGPGCSVGVSRGGMVIHERGYGMANLETATAIRPGTIFHVASVSKQFTAMAIMLLASDGRLALDDDIRKHLPEIPDYGARITIRHLLNHTSGLRDQWDLLIMQRGRFEENRITEADVLDVVARQKSLNFAPGSEYMYSNTGYTLAAVIVKRVSGQSLRDFAHERIFRRLGMSDTHFHDDYTMVVPGRAWAYAPRPGGGIRASIPNYDTYGATSLFTTVGDLLKWQSNFDSLRVGDRALLQAMQTSGVLNSGDTTGYALGLGVGTYRGARVVEHGGADAGYRSYLGRFPEHGLSIAIACNTATANTQALARRVADVTLGGALAAAPPEVALQGISVAVADLEKFAGVYFNPRTVQFMEFTVREGRLMLGRTGGTALTPVGENQFRANAGSGTWNFGRANGSVELRSTAGRVSTFDRKAAMPATRATMEQFAGEYFSEELGATYRVAATDSAVTFQTGTSAPIYGRPAFTDTFAARNYTVQFTRSGGRVTGFEMTSGRVRRVRFVRR